MCRYQRERLNCCEHSTKEAHWNRVKLTDESDIIFFCLAGQTREVRQTTERRDAREDGVGLSTTIAWDSIVPETLMRASDGLLPMIAMRRRNGGKRQKTERGSDHVAVLE